MERSKPFNKCSSGVLWLEAAADATTTSPGSSPKSSDKAPAPADQVTGAEQRLQTAPEHESILEQRHMELTQLVEAQGQEVCRCIDRRSEELFSRLEVLIHKQMQTQQELCSKFEAASLLRPVGRGADRRPRRASAPVGSGAVPRGIDRGIDRGAPTTVAAVVAAPAPPQIEPSPQPPSCGPTILEESVAPPGLVEEETTTVAVASRRWDEPSEEVAVQEDSSPSKPWNETGNDDGSDGDSDAFSDESVHPTASTKLLDREDEEAYQAALKKAKRLHTQETRTTLAMAASVSEHWQLRLHNFLNTAAVEGLCALVIFTNSVLIGVQTDYMAKRIGEEQPLVFTVIFGLELLVRLLGSGFGFFYRDPGLFWNYLDLFIVLPSIFELALSFLVELPSVSTDITVVRILRITRVFRVIRVVKVIKFIKSLRQLVESVIHTMRSLAWSMLLLVVIIYVFAIMFTDAAAAFKAEHEGHALNAELTANFADLHLSMHTLFRSVSGGIDWGTVALTLNEVHWIWVYLFTMYVAFCTFAVLNVMTGIFCQVAVESSWNDPQLLLQHSIVERERQRDLIRQLYHHFGQHKNRRKITLIDFEDQFEDEGVQGLMNLLDIYPDSAWSLFKQLDDNGDGSITEEEFVNGVFCLKGAAKSWDMDKIAQEQRGLKRVIDMNFARITGYLDSKPGTTLNGGD